MTESHPLTEQIVDEHPEEVDSRIVLTQLYLPEKNLKATETILDQILRRTRLTEDNLVSMDANP